jgi:hypothetical protein
MKRRKAGTYSFNNDYYGVEWSHPGTMTLSSYANPYSEKRHPQMTRLVISLSEGGDVFM